MLHSMTGFARQSAEIATGTLTWELKSVNHRYLDIQFRLPDDLRPHENRFRQQVGAALGRGKVECSLHFRRGVNRSSDLQLNQPLVDLLAARLIELNAAFEKLAPANPLDILRWPGVANEAPIDTQPLLVESVELLDKALASMATMRAGEGGRIADMLRSRCDEIERIARSVRARMPHVLDAVRLRQRERLQRLDIVADPARLELELALAAQKLDVDEELDRLDSHLVEIRTAIDGDEAVGRRLDFMMQELNREANTLASKAADADTTRAAVELKVLIEQMREQIQNVE